MNEFTAQNKRAGIYQENIRLEVEISLVNTDSWERNNLLFDWTIEKIFFLIKTIKNNNPKEVHMVPFRNIVHVLIF